tara:strand:- start:211 stop:828 length:618 start_codon:yes stop_codon:yes gene_type:complete
MATGDTDISICSDALILLGSTTISSFTEGTDLASACSRLYPDLRDILISRYPWSWSLKKVQLARLSAAPTNEWKYAYQLPGDMLTGVLALFSSNSSSAQSLNSGWEIYGDQVFTNLETVYIDYQATVTEADLPVYFVRLLRTALAGELAIPVTDQSQKADYFRGIAVGTPGESGRGGLFREAANIDSRGQINKVVQDYSLIDVRN